MSDTKRGAKRRLSLLLLLLLLLLPKRRRISVLLANVKPSGSWQESRGLLGERGGHAACTSQAKP